MLIVDCLNKAAEDIAGCLTSVGLGAEPGQAWSDTPAATCNSYDRKGMIGCLTGAAEQCCYVLGVNGCSLMINNQVVTIF